MITFQSGRASEGVCAIPAVQRVHLGQFPHDLGDVLRFLDSSERQSLII